MDLKTSQFGTITAVQANSAGTEGYIPYVDPSQVDPDLRNKRMTRSEAKKFFGLDLFTALSGTAWDGTNKTLTLTSNTALTFSSTKRNGILRVKQDGTGSRTLSINTISVPISSGANTITVISYFYDDVAGLYVFSYDTNILGNVGGSLITLNTPGSFAAVTGVSGEIDLSWTDTNTSPNEVGYRIYFNGINDFGSAGVLLTTAANVTSYSHTGLTPGSPFYYWIKAVGDGTTTLDSGTASANAAAGTGGGGGTFTSTNRVAFYKMSTMVRSAGAVTQWTNADGDTAKDFAHYSFGTDPTDATTDGMLIAGGANLKTAARVSITAPITMYFLLKKLGDGAMLANTSNGNGYGLLLTTSGGIYLAPNADGGFYFQNPTNVANMSGFKVITLTWAGGTTVPKIYVDGVLQGTFTQTGGSGPYSVFDIDYLGGYASNNANLDIQGMAFFNSEHDATTVGTQYSLFQTAAGT